eukprot:15083098-Alexandrium_andersonii.AAC.1
MAAEVPAKLLATCSATPAPPKLFAWSMSGCQSDPKKRCARPACALHRRQDESTASSSSLA